MLEKLQFLLSSFYFHGSQFKNKINGKIENRTEPKNALYSEYPARVPPSLQLLLWHDFPRNIHPK